MEPSHDEFAMPCVNMIGIVNEAKAGGYAVGAFNVVDCLTMRAVIHAAEGLASPVVVQTSVSTVAFWGRDLIAAWYREVAGSSPVPVSLHLDHCTDPSVVEACIVAGWTSVMFDGSRLPLGENAETTARIAARGRDAGVSVEAELGRIGGVEEEIAEDEGMLTDPEDAARFVRIAGPDVLAPAVGTAHGLYEREPRVDVARIAAIARLCGVPLALHGGTGLDPDVIRGCVAAGCAKVNFSTVLKHATLDAHDAYRRRLPVEYEPLRVFRAQDEAVAAVVGEAIRILGSGGRV
jgi:tagatose 1,6-diphosphate aldolase GatY/KbaY